MTDNRTNEQLAERLRQFAESQAMDFDNPHIAMTLEEIADRLTGTITEAQVEAAAKALREMRDFDEGVSSTLLDSWSRMVATTALVAAQGAAPQAECTEAPGGRPCEASKPGHKLHWSNEAKEERGNVKLITDARALSEYVSEHIPGSRYKPMIDRLANALEACPVLPSSTVDEGKIAEVIAKATYDWSQQRLEFWRRPACVESPGDLDQFIARAVVEAIGGESRAARE